MISTIPDEISSQFLVRFTRALYTVPPKDLLVFLYLCVCSAILSAPKGVLISGFVWILISDLFLCPECVVKSLFVLCRSRVLCMHARKQTLPEMFWVTLRSLVLVMSK